MTTARAIMSLNGLSRPRCGAATTVATTAGPNGTTGLVIGGAAGALLGRELDRGENRTLGTVLGAAGGALLGREVERGRARCQ